MLTTTFYLARKAGACQEEYHLFARHVGGIRKYGASTPISLTEVAAVLGLDDALWCLRCTQQPAETERLARPLAADFAEHVLHLFEEKYPNDKRPREAIEAARKFARGEMGAAAGAAAWDAAWDAAWAAAGAAARDAAGAAAWAAAWAATGAAARTATGAAAWAAAWAAARTATGAAARDAAGAAARTATGAAEREWQLNRFMEVINA